MRQRVSRNHRKNLKALSIVHPTLYVRLFLFSARAFVSVKFWDKLHYVDRIEELELDGVLPASAINELLPGGVADYERELKEEAELAREVAIAAGAPLAPRERQYVPDTESNVAQ